MRLGSAVIIEDACRGIGLPLPDGQTTIRAAHDKLAALGVRFIGSSALRTS